MALEILIMKDVTKPYWEDEWAIHFGDIDPDERGCLFHKDFRIMTYFEYSRTRNDAEVYVDYYAKQISLIREKFPLIARIKDYYEDASFSKDEINQLVEEIRSLNSVVTHQGSINLLDQLLAASQIALENKAGMILVAD